MNKQALTEALAWDHELVWAIRNEAQFPKEADAGTELLQTIIAAARLVERLLPGECEHGSTEPHKLAYGSDERYCDGQGWDEGIVEAVADQIALAIYNNEIDLINEWSRDKSRATSRAVLSALVELLTEKVET